jgi:hypothetical protein
MLLIYKYDYFPLGRQVQNSSSLQELIQRRPAHQQFMEFLLHLTSQVFSFIKYLSELEKILCYNLAFREVTDLKKINSRPK